MPFGSEFWTGPEAVLRGYLARQELNQRQQQLDQERQNAQDTLKLHHQQLDQAMKAHMDDLKYRNMVFKQAATEKYNQLYGDPLSADSQYITGIQPQTQVSQQPQIGQAAGEPQAPTGISGVGIPNAAGSLTPDIQHNLQFQARPWQMEIPGAEGMGIGPITIDPNYQARESALALKQGNLEAQAALEKAKKLYPFTEAAARQKYDEDMARTLALISGRAQVGAAHDLTSRFRAALSYLAQSEKGEAGKHTPDEVTGRSEELLTSPTGPTSSPLDAVSTKNIRAQGWEPPRKGQMDNATVSKFNKVMEMSDKIDNFSNTLRDDIDPKTGQPVSQFSKFVGAGKSALATSDFLGKVLYPDQAAAYGDVQALIPGLVADIADYRNRLAVPELKFGKNLDVDTLETRHSGAGKALNVRSLGYKWYWDNVLPGPASQKIYSLEKGYGGIDPMIANLSTRPGQIRNYKMKNGQTIDIISKGKDGGYRIFNPDTEKWVPIKQYRLAPYQPPTVSNSDKIQKMKEAIDLLDNSGLLRMLDNGTDQQ